MPAPGFYFCISPDSFLAREHVENLLPDFSNQAEVHVFWGDEGLDGAFWDHLTRPGFVAASKLLLLRHAELLNAETWKKLSSALGTPRDGVVPVFFLEVTWEKGAPKLPAHIAKLRCLDFAQKQGWTWKHPALDSRSHAAYMKGRARQKGLEIEPEALDALIMGIAPDGAATDAALDMLGLLGGKTITVDSARQLSAHNPELAIFEFIRHLQSGSLIRMWKTLAIEGEGAENLLFPLLALLARESRQLWQDLAGERTFFPAHVAQAKRALARRLGKKGLARVFMLLMEAELAVKSGTRQPRQALEELAASLSLIFRT